MEIQADSESKGSLESSLAESQAFTESTSIDSESKKLTQSTKGNLKNAQFTN